MRIDFGSWQATYEAAPGLAKDYYRARLGEDPNLDEARICREMNDEEWDYVESQAGSIACKIGIRMRRERLQGQKAGRWSKVVFLANKARLRARWMKKCALSNSECTVRI